MVVMVAAVVNARRKSFSALRQWTSGGVTSR